MPTVTCCGIRIRCPFHRFGPSKQRLASRPFTNPRTLGPDPGYVWGELIPPQALVFLYHRVIRASLLRARTPRGLWVDLAGHTLGPI
eukprot:7442830-Alexandrium_andersonii.AAC.1